MLEAFASEREVVANELQELNAKIQKLENEKVERSESRKRFEKVRTSTAGPNFISNFIHF
jgi:RILP-like protein 1